MECIHCGETGSIVLPENHDEEYDKPLCTACENYQVESGLELLEERFI